MGTRTSPHVERSFAGRENELPPHLMSISDDRLKTGLFETDLKYGGDFFATGPLTPFHVLPRIKQFKINSDDHCVNFAQIMRRLQSASGVAHLLMRNEKLCLFWDVPMVFKKGPGTTRRPCPWWAEFLQGRSKYPPHRRQISRRINNGFYLEIPCYLPHGFS